MYVENAALYRQLHQNVKLPWATVLWFLGLALLASGLTGCTPEKQKPGAPAAKDAAGQSGQAAAAPRTTVPLRVWFVADAADKAIIERQWEATYDRPIDVHIFTDEELLQQSAADCDTLVYPAWMIGELIARKWITELPAKLLTAEPVGEDELAARPQPAAWLEQARFDRKLWGLSLSVITPVILANFEIPTPRMPRPEDSIAAEESIAYWQSLIDALKAQPATESKQTAPVSGDIKTDPMAVCDRFLTVLFSVSSNENRIGALLHPDDLAPRVTDANFKTAAKILMDLQAASPSAEALCGSHSSAWQILVSQQPTITIGLPAVPSPDVDKVNSVVVRQPPSNPARSGMRVTAGWNSGRGLVVSIARQSRQSGASIDFSRWIASESSRQGFAKRIAGITSESAFAPGSSAWQAQRVMQRLGQQVRMPAEPRLPMSQAYRQTLGEHIASILLGRQSIDDALGDLDKAWRELNAKADTKEQTDAYLKSLGL